jgi:cell division protein FtsQ
MKKFLYKISSNQNMLRYALAATILLFMVFYNRAGRHKVRSLSGKLIVSVKHLESGNDFITGEEMRERVRKKFQSEFASVPVGSLSPMEVEASLQSLDFIKTADVFVDGNNCLNIYVTQREPMFRLLNAEGQSFYIDKEGTMMPASMHYSPRVLVAFAPITLTRDTIDYKKPGLQKEMFDLANLIVFDEVLHALVEEIVADVNGEWMIIPKIGPSRILLGKLDRIEDKLNDLKRVYKVILPAQGWDKYYSVNLKYQGQVICTKRA